MDIISRAQWGAQHDDGFRGAPMPAPEVWLHHSVTIAPDLAWLDADRDGVDDDEERAMRTLEDIGENRFGGGISYTWLVMPSGRIYQGHSPWRQGAHTGGRNDRARAICFVGNYEDRDPTAAQERAAAWLLQYAKFKGWIKYARLNGGHRDVKSTACPGSLAYSRIAEINRLAAGGPIGGGGAAPGGDNDMDATESRMLRELHELWRKGNQTEGHPQPVGEGTGYVVEMLLRSRRQEAVAAGLQRAVDKLADAVGGKNLTADELKAAVKAGTAEALEEGTVNVDIDVTGPEGKNA